MKIFKLYHEDCLKILPGMPENSIDSIVTDPPYGLSFMGKKWDYDVPTVDIWKECLRVLKPGGHLLAFGGTRTYHRLVVAIEDAGFEIRDQIQWIYGSGFPKATDCAKQAIKEGIACGCKTQPEHEMRSVQETDLSKTFDTANQSGEVLQSIMSEQSSQEHGGTRTQSGDGWGEESGLEGRSIHRTGEGLLYDSDAGPSESETQRLCVGTHSGSGENAGPSTDTDGSGSSHKSRPSGQSTRKPEGIQRPQGALDGSSFPRCPGCERPIFPEGWKSALKPANEPICLARKPLSESTIAKNVLKHGTGGLNIDGSRIETTDNLNGGAYSGEDRASKDGNIMKIRGDVGAFTQPVGRFPSNVILDEDAAQVLDGQVGPLHQRGNKNPTKRGGGMFGHAVFEGTVGLIDSSGNTSASRFFYCAKASKSDRNYGLDGHETITINSGLCKEENTVLAALLQKVISESTVTWSIDESGKAITAQFQKGCKSIIETAISKTTVSKILSLLHRLLTNASIQDVSLKTENGSNLVENAVQLSQWILNITQGKTASALGVVNVALQMPQKIKDAEEQPLKNTHSTVKPIKLMEYIVKLITPEGGIVLDPFMGSGTTGVACSNLDFSFIGIEMNSDYIKIAESRTAAGFANE